MKPKWGEVAMRWSDKRCSDKDVKWREGEMASRWSHKKIKMWTDDPSPSGHYRRICVKATDDKNIQFSKVLSNTEQMRTDIFRTPYRRTLTSFRSDSFVFLLKWRLQSLKYTNNNCICVCLCIPEWGLSLNLRDEDYRLRVSEDKIVSII